METVTSQGASVAKKRGEQNYNDFREEIVKPVDERRVKLIGRSGDAIKGRVYHLTDDEMASLVKEAESMGKVVNPCGIRKGVYWAQVQALIDLGANEYHSLKAVREQMYKIMSVIAKQKKVNGKVIETTMWADFYEKSGREAARSPKDGEGKILQNFRVLQRLPKLADTAKNSERNPYGLPLAQFKMSIDIELREVTAGVDLPFFCLNTMWASEDLVSPKLPRFKRKRTARAEVVEKVEEVVEKESQSE